MRNWMWLLAFAVALTFGASLNAQIGTPKGEKVEEKEGEKEKEAEKEEEEPAEDDYLGQIKAQFKDIDTVIKGVTLTEADIKSYQKYESEFDELVDSDPEFEKLSNKSIKQAFDYALKSEKYIAWAAKRELKAEDWLRKAVRMLTFGVREGLVGMDEAIDSMKDARKQVEGMKDSMEEAEYKEALEGVDKAIAMYEGLRDFGKTLPAPTEAEAKLLKELVGSDEGGSRKPSEEEEDMD